MLEAHDKPILQRPDEIPAKKREELRKHIPRILGLKAMGMTNAAIASAIGVSYAVFKRFCKREPDLQDVCSCLEYRREYVLAQLFEDFKQGHLTERGGLKLLETIANLQLLDLRKDLLQMEVELKRNGTISEESRLKINGISEEEINATMHSMTRRGQAEKGDCYHNNYWSNVTYKPGYDGPGFQGLY